MKPGRPAGPRDTTMARRCRRRGLPGTRGKAVSNSGQRLKSIQELTQHLFCSNELFDRRVCSFKRSFRPCDENLPPGFERFLESEGCRAWKSDAARVVIVRCETEPHTEVVFCDSPSAYLRELRRTAEIHGRDHSRTFPVRIDGARCLVRFWCTGIVDVYPADIDDPREGFLVIRAEDLFGGEIAGWAVPQGVRRLYFGHEGDCALGSVHDTLDGALKHALSLVARGKRGPRYF